MRNHWCHEEEKKQGERRIDDLWVAMNMFLLNEVGKNI